MFRKTVAAIMDEVGIPASAIADQLGKTQAVVDNQYHAKPPVNAKRAVNEAGDEALEGSFGTKRNAG